MLVVPAVKLGSNGNGLRHGPPSGPVLISNVEDDSTAGLPDHGSIDATVVYEPHNAGVPNGALLPPKKCSLKSSNGNCGVFLNVETNWPVTGSGTTSPASFTRDPETGSSTYTYKATREPNGFAFCAAKYAAPTSEFGNSGVCISTVPTLDASGHNEGPALS